MAGSRSSTATSCRPPIERIAAGSGGLVAWPHRGATLLALTLFDRLAGSAGAPVVARKTVDPATLLVAVLPSRWPCAGVFPAWAFPAWRAVDAVCSGVQLIGCTMLCRYRRGAGSIWSSRAHGAIVSCCRPVAARSTGLRVFARRHSCPGGLSAVTSSGSRCYWPSLQPSPR